MLQTAYKDNALGKTQVYEWFSGFNTFSIKLSLTMSHGTTDMIQKQKDN